MKKLKQFGAKNKIMAQNSTQQGYALRRSSVAHSSTFDNGCCDKRLARMNRILFRSRSRNSMVGGRGGGKWQLLLAVDPR